MQVIRSNNPSQDISQVDEVEIFGFIDNPTQLRISIADLKSIDNFFTHLEFIEIVILYILMFSA